MQNIDDKIMKLFEVVKTQREEVARAEKETKQSWKTKCVFELNAQRYNIQTAQVPDVVQIVKILLIEQEYLKDANRILNLEFDDKLCGFAFDEWLADCNKRVSVIQLKQKKDKLVDLENRLQAIVSPEQKRLMELASITESLGL